MRRFLVSLATAAALAVAVVPAAWAADPSPMTADPTASQAPTAVAGDPAPTPGPYDGTVVEDPTFVSGGELPTQPPATPAAPGAPATPGRPAITPPPTDAPAAGQRTADGSAALLLLFVAGAAFVALLATRAGPRTDRRRSRRG